MPEARNSCARCNGRAHNRRTRLLESTEHTNPIYSKGAGTNYLSFRFDLSKSRLSNAKLRVLNTPRAIYLPQDTALGAPEKSIPPIEILNFTFGYLKHY